MIALLACVGPTSTPHVALDDSDAGLPHSSVDSSADSSVDSPSDSGDGPDLRALSELVLRATHNSYEGGERGSLTAQLDAGVRFVELDVHDDDYDDEGYRVGHLFAGNAVDHDGNPDGDGLGDWLAVIADWSAAHPQAAPIVVGVDIKDDLTDNVSHGAGNLAALGDTIEAAFGDRLLRELGGLDEMRGGVAVVYSGDEDTRLGYIRDEGANPAIAVNASGQVVEVHDSGRGALWYWTGQLDGTELTWQRHGSLGSGWDPAVALSDDGEVLLISTNTGNVLDHRSGEFDGEDITWSAATAFDTGVNPSLEWLGGDLYREVHESPTTGANWFWDIELRGGSVSLGDHSTTEDARYDETSAGGLQAATDGDVLVVNGERIRYPEVAFVELQRGDDALIEAEARFAAVGSGDSAQVETWLGQGLVVRVWGFDSDDAGEATIPQLPATDTPNASWYEAWCVEVGAVD